MLHELRSYLLSPTPKQWHRGWLTGTSKLRRLIHNAQRVRAVAISAQRDKRRFFYSYSIVPSPPQMHISKRFTLQPAPVN